MQPLYALAATAISPLLPMLINHRLNEEKEDFARINERYGKTTRQRPHGPIIWCHAASVGEANSILLLIENILAARKDVHVLMTTGTVTSAEVVARRRIDRLIHQYAPFDVPHIVNRFLNFWQPQLALWVESELWPTMLSSLRKRRIPAVFLNARLSDKSYRKWQRTPGWIKSILSTFSLCLSQTESDIARLQALGATHVAYAGNLKFAADPLPVVESGLTYLRTQIGARPCWLMASTHPGEEAYALTTHQELKQRFHDLLTVIVPRHPDRGESIAAMLTKHGAIVAQRSQNDPINAKTDIYIADTLGELGLFYRLTPVVCLGGSFGALGGHNPIEPAWLGCALLCGPDMKNFAEVAEIMKAQEALWQVPGPAELMGAVTVLLNKPKIRDSMADRAREIAQQNRVVLDHVLALLNPYLNGLR